MSNRILISVLIIVSVVVGLKVYNDSKTPKLAS